MGAGALAWWAQRALRREVERAAGAARRLGLRREEEKKRRREESHEPAAPDASFQPLHDALSTAVRQLRQRTVPRAHLNDILNSMTEVLLVLGPARRVQRANRAATEALGYEASELRGLPLRRLLPEAETAGASSTGGDPARGEGTLRRKDGSTLPVLFSYAPLHGERAGKQRAVCVAQDLSERQTAQERLRQSLEEKDVLLREIHHRVKNNLQVISSLLSLQEDGEPGDRATRRLAASRQRIRSMALVHERLYRSSDLARIDVSDYLDDLGDHLMRVHNAGHVRFERHVEAGPLPVGRAIPLGLVANELVANAFEHAFSSNGTDAPALDLRFWTDGPTATLVVEDNGTGLPDDLTTDDLGSTGSMGLKLVRALTGQLNGTLEVTDKGRSAGSGHASGAHGLRSARGLRFIVAFPLEGEEGAASR
ncbi:MAG: response regulator [Bacteroidetes bacterium QS_9_68_14]|nr:MAG: response regulator [Bacteroidetes bacterium QS_9_68_14]